MIVLLMGVAGSGKSAVGAALAQRHGILFVDGDDLHPRENVAKMAAGIPLTDDDRLPWLRAIRNVLQAHSASATSAVVACSALKESYRRLLLDGLPEVRLVYLRGSREVLEPRVGGRKGHFFDPRLLDSQLEVLEEPSEAITVDIEANLEEVTAAVASAVGLAAS